MGIVDIINIIMQILAFIAGLFAPKTSALRTVAYVTEFDCSAAQWSVPVSISGGVLSGTVETTCVFEGKGRGGIAALQAHMLQQLPKDSEVKATSWESHRGLPGVTLQTSLSLADGVAAQGLTRVTSNGKNLLRNVFESKSFTQVGAGKFMKGLYSEMEVTRTPEGFYKLHVIQGIEIKKPLLISASEFQSSLKDRAEESIQDRAVSALQEMASHL